LCIFSKKTLCKICTEFSFIATMQGLTKKETITSHLPYIQTRAPKHLMVEL
jgi:hypothetical protein